MIDPVAVFNRAINALNEKAHDFPLAEVDRALQIAPIDHRLWQVKGLIHRELDQRELAIPALRRAAELAPEDGLIAHGYARTLLEAGVPSVDAFARALKLSPGDAGVVQGLAAALIADGRPDEAIAGIEAVVRRSPLWVEGHTLLAQLRWANGEPEDFTRSFDEALQLHPASLQLRTEQMAVLVEADRFEDVLAKVLSGRRAVGSHATFLNFEAVAQSELGDAKSADLSFAKIQRFESASTDVRLIRHLLRTDRADQSVPLIDHWLETPERQFFWPSAATAWRLTGDKRSEWLESDDRLIGVYDITGELPPLDRLSNVVRNVHKLRGQMLAQSVRGGTQTDGHLLQRIEPEIAALRAALIRVVARHIANLPRLDSRHPSARAKSSPIRFSGAWSVRLTGGGRHTNHVHPMGWLSSALYLALPPGLGGEKHAGWLTLGEPDSTLGLNLPPRRMVEPKPGRLVLFPSWMWHGTRPFGEGERLTVAFDVA